MELNAVILSRGATKLHWEDPLVYHSLIITPRKNYLGPRLEAKHTTQLHNRDWSTNLYLNKAEIKDCLNSFRLAVR